MPERPTFWIHRTRLFWLGIGTLVFLIFLVLSMGYFKVEVEYDPRSSGSMVSKQGVRYRKAVLPENSADL